MITTGSKALDKMLGGGIEAGCITLFCGGSKTGKTRLMFQLAVNTRKINEKAQSGKTIFVDAERTYNMNIIVAMGQEMYDFNNINMEPSVTPFVIKVWNLEEQLNTIDQIRNRIERNRKRLSFASKLAQELTLGVILLVVDSISRKFDYGEDHKATLDRYLQDLVKLTEDYPDMAIVLTCKEESPFMLTKTISKVSKYTILLEKREDGEAIARMLDDELIPFDKCVFTFRIGPHPDFKRLRYCIGDIMDNMGEEIDKKLKENDFEYLFKSQLMEKIDKEKLKPHFKGFLEYLEEREGNRNYTQDVKDIGEMQSFNFLNDQGEMMEIDEILYNDRINRILAEVRKYFGIEELKIFLKHESTTILGKLCLKKDWEYYLQ